MDKARAEQWMNMYLILDRLTFEESCVRVDQGITGQFPSRVSYLIDEVQIGSICGQCF